MAKGLSAAKAKKILEDGKVRGKALTEKQKKFFGAVAGGATPLKKLNGGWLEKFDNGGVQPNYNDSNVSLPPGFKGYGYDKGGRAYNGAWDGPVTRMGGTIPGATGMMYARTSGISPEEPKKAQNGEVMYGTPEYEAAYREGRFANVPNPLDEVVIDSGVDYNQYPLYDKLSAQQKEYFNDPGPIGRGVRRAAQTDRGLAEDTRDMVTGMLVQQPLSAIQAPQSLMVEGIETLRGRDANLLNALTFDTQRLPSQTMGFEDKPGWDVGGSLNTAMDVIADPLNFVGVGLALPSIKKFTRPLKNIGKYYRNPLGDAFKIGNNNPNIPTFLTRGQNPPNKILTNSKMDADNFMQSWTNAPGFMERYNKAVLKPSATPKVFENYIKSATPKYNQLLDEAKEAEKLLGKRSFKAGFLRSEANKLAQEIDMSYRSIYPNIARDNLKAIQAGEFNTIYSTSGFSPGSGGTYYWPTAKRPMNTYKYMYPGKPNTIGTGNSSVVKIREVPIGATKAARTKARTSEMLTGIHETLGHASNLGGAALTKQNADLVKSALKKNLKIKEGTADWVTDFLGPEATFKDWAKYLQEPTEMIARVQEIRRQYIPKEFWGTNKQYEVTDKLVDRIFRDGLSGNAKVPADFFRVIDKKGLKKLMKGLYATIPLAAGANEMLETETPKYKDGGRCWPGYKTVPGKTPFSKGSCQKAEDGGWLDKFQEGGVIEDDRGQWAYPGEVTKINSNNITMKGVNYPVLGISDTGDIKMMQPGVDNYKYDGNSVTEYPMAQEGAGVNKEGVKQYRWFKNYIRSPKYKERLKKEFPDYNNRQIEQEAKSRLQNIMQTRVGFLPFSSEHSKSIGSLQGFYDDDAFPGDAFPGAIMLRPEYSASTSDYIFEPGNYLSGYKTIPLHEWSHAADDGGNRMPQSTTDLMLSKMKENSLDIPKDKYYYTRPTEYLGRMQPLRYLMQQEGLYDAGTQDFTKEDLENAKQNKTIKNNQHFQDLMENVKSDEDFIELMNKVASVNQKDNSRTMMAKDGKSLVELNQLTNFTNYNTPQPGGWLDKYH